MSMETDLVARLLADEDVSALIDDRLSPGFLPPGESYPAMTYLLVSNGQVRNTQGSEGMEQARYQINCWASTYKQAKELAAAVKACLDNFRGEMGDTAVHAIFWLDEADASDSGPDIDADVPRGIRQDYQIRYAT